MMRVVTRPEAEEIYFRWLYKNKSPPTGRFRTMTEQQVSIVTDLELEEMIFKAGNPEFIIIETPLKLRRPNGIYCPQAFV